MKEYIKRLTSTAKTWEIIMWWIFRSLMIFAMIKGIIGLKNGTNDISDPLQVFGNLLGMFVWEVFQMFPKKCFPRHMPSVMQDILVVMAFCASFCGKFLNFYYDVRWWDSGMHLLSGGLCVLIGYEVVVAMQKRDKKTVATSVAVLCAFGFSFFASTCWELFEFIMDQVMCKTAAQTGGTPGDAQHWCWALAQGTPKESTIFNPYFTDGANGYDRWPLMDTMQDIILNTIGAVVAWIVLKIRPYHHKGKNDINRIIEEENSAVTEKEVVNV